MRFSSRNKLLVVKMSVVSLCNGLTRLLQIGELLEKFGEIVQLVCDFVEQIGEVVEQVGEAHLG